ncbi:MAG: hypothetical protein U0166_27535 [Acidobacteriota bacterium]
MADEAGCKPPFACRIVIRADGTVVIENLGEGLEEIAKLLEGSAPDEVSGPDPPMEE